MTSPSKPSTARPDNESIRRDIEATKSAADGLEQMLRSLPHVEPDGSSECPFADKLHAEKERAQQNLQTRYGALHTHRQYVQSELRRYHNATTVLRAQQTRLHGDQARSSFSDAEAKAAAQHTQYAQLLDEIEEAIEHVQEVLHTAAAKNHPKGDDLVPEESPRRASSGTEAGGLLELERRRAQR